MIWAPGYVPTFDHYLSVMRRRQLTDELLRRLEREGALLSWRKFVNKTVDAGLVQVALLVSGQSVAGFQYQAIGTGNTAPAAGQTTLVTEKDRVRYASLLSINSGKGFELDAFFPSTSPAAGQTIAEEGIFNAASVGTMLQCALFSSSFLFPTSATLTTAVQWTGASAT
jgi:hypothetical protein